MSTSKSTGLTVIAFALGIVSASAQLGSSTDDLWDVSRGAVITGQSTMLSCRAGGPASFDARDIFGGHFATGTGCSGEPDGTVIFDDGKPDGFVNYVEWAMPAAVTIRSFELWALGDAPPFPDRREMSSFQLLAKSPGSTSYDLKLYSFTPSHSYTFVNNVYGLLISTDIKPTTAREFRAEFVSRTTSPPDSRKYGPRVLELDGFGQFIGPTAVIRVSEAEVSWQSAAGLKYQVEFREDVPGSNWDALGAQVVGTGGVMKMTDKVAAGAATRFYRVRAME